MQSIRSENSCWTHELAGADRGGAPKAKIPVSSVRSLAALEVLWLKMCLLDMSAADVAQCWPGLKKAPFVGVPKLELRELSRQVPAVLFSNESDTFLNGETAVLVARQR